MLKMDKIRDLAIGLFFITAAWYLYEARQAIAQRQPEIDAIIFNARTASLDARETLKEIKNVTRIQSNFINVQSEKFAAENENISGYARGGRVFYETLLSLQQTAAHLGRLAEGVDGAQIAEGAGILRDTAGALRETAYSARNTLDRGADTLRAGERLAVHADGLLVGPIRYRLIDNAGAVLEAHTELAESALDSVRIFNQRWPTTMDRTNMLLLHSSGAMGQVEIGLQRFNKPLTLRQKLSSIFVESLIKSSPVLIRR